MAYCIAVIFVISIMFTWKELPLHSLLSYIAGSLAVAACVSSSMCPPLVVASVLSIAAVLFALQFLCSRIIAGYGRSARARSLATLFILGVLAASGSHRSIYNMRFKAAIPLTVYRSATLNTYYACWGPASSWESFEFTMPPSLLNEILAARDYETIPLEERSEESERAFASKAAKADVVVYQWSDNSDFVDIYVWGNDVSITVMLFRSRG